MKSLYLFLLLLEISTIFAKTYTTNDLASALSNASPGDIIELKAGTYSQVPYRLVSGSSGKPITIKAVKGATVKFSTGSKTICIFDFNGVSYANIEGPFELVGGLCGVKAMDVTNVKISGLKVHDTQQHGIVISGEDNEVSNNEVYNCVMENKDIGITLDYGWSQCVAAWGKNYNSGFSKNIVFKNNYIHEAYGEGLDFLKCDGCSAISNNITNGFSMNIYIDVSKNIVIDGNILRVTSENYNTQWGKACAIGLAAESGGTVIDNILIQNNIAIGTRMAVYFFMGGYNNVKILHNTFWYVSVTPVWFKSPTNNPTNCEMRNNFIYYEYQLDFLPKSAWTIGNNYYYNIENVPSIYSDTVGGSRAAKTLDLTTVFYNKDGNCNYYNYNLDADCLRPSPYWGDWLKLYQSGTKPKTAVTKDIYGCTRSTSTPSIDAFEYPIGCTGTIPEDPSDLKVKFKINYCTSNSDVIKMIGDFCSWSVASASTFTNEGSCNWVYTYNTPSATMSYKFVTANGNSVTRWESDPNRTFNYAALKSAVKTSSSGKYQNCDYVKSGSLVTLTCTWR